ncbi:MAG: hypothetical protein PHY02_01675 [Phycisphaerae bacterium]|nr:hypothetical protein [Phycisphaerae bacterium]
MTPGIKPGAFGFMETPSSVFAKGYAATSKMTGLTVKHRGSNNTNI